MFGLLGSSAPVGPTIVGMDSSLLMGWYQIQATDATLAAMRAQGIDTSARQTQRDEVVTPPWDVRLKPPNHEVRLREAMSSSSLFNRNDPFFRQDIPEDQKQLFELYKATNLLQALAASAADEDTFSGLRPGLDSRFQSGLSEVFAYIDKLAADSYVLTRGVKEDKVDSDMTIARPNSVYTGQVAVNGAFDSAIGGLSGTEVFTISVVKFGTTTDVTIDLANVSGTLNLDNIVTYANTQLEAAGVMTRLKRVRVEPDYLDKEADDYVAPNTFGIEVTGVSTEKISFSAQSASPAIFLAGASGDADHEFGTFLKLTDLSSGTPAVSAGESLQSAAGGTSRAIESGIDSDGNVYVVGSAEGALEGVPNQGDRDVFVSKYDSTGNLLWTRLLGASDSAEGFALAIDSNDNVIVTGSVDGDLSSSSIGGAGDSFVTKFDSSGQEVFTRQISPLRKDAGNDIAVGADGSIYVTGVTSAAMTSAQTYGGGTDAFITKLDSAGTLQYHRQIGGLNDEIGLAISVDQNGDLISATLENGEAVVRKYSSANGTDAAIWETNLGAISGGSISSVVVENNEIYIGGSTGNTAFGAGSVVDAHTTYGQDGFVTKLTDSGSSVAADYTTFIGTVSLDKVNDLTVLNGEVYMAGEVRGDLAGGTMHGTVNGFAAKLSTLGVRDWSHQYSGRDGKAVANTITVDSSGDSVLDILGLPKNVVTTQSRTITAQSSVRDGDYFYISVDGGHKRKITIDADDTMRALAFKINAVLLLDGEARSRRTSEGDRLRIEVKEGVRVDLIAGPEGRDALVGLGLKEGTLYDDGSILDEKTPVDEAQSTIYGLGLASTLSLKEPLDASYALELIDNALSVIRDVYRDITKDPALEEALNSLNKGKGPVPAYLTSQISNYQAGLARLGAVSGGGLSSLFV